MKRKRSRRQFGRTCVGVQWELRDLLCGSSVLDLKVHIFNNLCEDVTANFVELDLLGDCLREVAWKE